MLEWEREEEPGHGSIGQGSQVDDEGWRWLLLQPLPWGCLRHPPPRSELSYQTNNNGGKSLLPDQVKLPLTCVFFKNHYRLNPSNYFGWVVRGKILINDLTDESGQLLVLRKPNLFFRVYFFSFLYFTTNVPPPARPNLLLSQPTMYHMSSPSSFTVEHPPLFLPARPLHRFVVLHPTAPLWHPSLFPALRSSSTKLFRLL